MHSLLFRQKFRLLTVMAASAANEVPRAPQANVVLDILAEQSPIQPILNANGLEVMCLPFFHTSLALLPLFMCTCRRVLICPFPAFTCVVFVLHSIQLTFFFWPFFLCCLFAFSQFYPIASAFVIQSILVQFLALRPYIARLSSISSFPTFFCRLGFYFDYFRLEKFLDYLLLPHSRCNSLYCLAFLQLAFRFGFAGIQLDFLIRFLHRFVIFDFVPFIVL